MSQLEELKKIIVGDNVADVEKLKQRIENLDSRTKDIAEVLPTAIEKRIKQDERLAQALQKPISESIKVSILREPKEYADILYPIMSPAIRLSIASAIRSMLATINQTVESATSLRGWRWRLDAMKTGVPYAEIALRHALLYRVEQVFLIDNKTGLLLSNLVNEDVVEKDSDAVSAMFTAIQSFVQDSFSNNQEDQLTDMAVGEHRVWVVHGSSAMLACVIRGMAPASLRTQLIEILENIHIDYAKPLVSFNGDVNRFKGVENHLEPCLSLKLKDYDGEKKTLPLGSVLGALLLLVMVAYWCFNSMQQRSQLNDVSQALSEAPGVLKTDIYWQDGKLQVYGLRDPFAKLPWTRFAQTGISENQINFQLKPYRSLESEIVTARYREQYKVPEDVQLNINNQTLFFSGIADLQWLNELPMHVSDAIQSFDFKKLFATQPSIISHVKQSIGLPAGVKLTLKNKHIIVAGNSNSSWVAKLNALFADSLWVSNIRLADSASMHQMINDIAKLSFLFTNKIEISEQSIQLLNTSAKKINNIIAIAKKLDLPLTINIVGFTDDVGSGLLNQQLRVDRAQLIRQQLMTHGIPEALLAIKTMPELQAKTKERSARIYISTTTN